VNRVEVTRPPTMTMARGRDRGRGDDAAHRRREDRTGGFIPGGLGEEPDLEARRRGHLLGAQALLDALQRHTVDFRGGLGLQKKWQPASPSPL
jgi:hypothetical protein